MELKPLLGGSWAPVKGHPDVADPQKPMTAEQMKAIVDSLPSLADLYAQILKEGPEAYAFIAGLIADGKHTLIHCTAGKDRTGVGSALVLDAVGVERDAIITDYSKTHDNLSGAWADAMTAQLKKQGVELNDKLMDLLTASPEDVMAETLTRIDNEYGGSAAYLTSGGLTEDQLNALRTTLRAS